MLCSNACKGSMFVSVHCLWWLFSFCNPHIITPLIMLILWLFLAARKSWLQNTWATSLVKRVCKETIEHNNESHEDNRERERMNRDQQTECLSHRSTEEKWRWWKKMKERDEGLRRMSKDIYPSSRWENRKMTYGLLVRRTWLVWFSCSHDHNHNENQAEGVWRTNISNRGS